MRTPIGKSVSAATQRRLRRKFSAWRKLLLDSKRYRDYIYTAASRDRLAAFLAVEACLGDGDYWSLLRDVYQDAELIMPDLEVWLRLFRANRGGRGNLMKGEEHASLARLTEVIEIYRGCGTKEGILGMSWTLNHERAIWFARYSCEARRRFNFPQFAGSSPLLVTGRCKRSDLLAHFSERQESEIVLDPELVEITAVESVAVDRTVRAKIA